jgi:hypothetical protein
MRPEDIERTLKEPKLETPRKGLRCPDEVVIASYADATLPETDREKVENHLADCRFCLEQVGFLARVKDTEPLGPVPQKLLVKAKEITRAGHVPSRVPRLRWAVAAAASMTIILATAFWLFQMEPVRNLRGAHTTDPAELPELVFPQEGATLARQAVEFRWEALPESLFYELSLVTEEGDLVWKERFEETRASLAEGVEIQSGRKYYVWIRAHLSEGKTLKSNAVGFNVEDDP